MTRTEIISEARSYLRTPLHHRGRIKGAGIDCIGLIVGITKFFGVSQHDLSEYPEIIPAGLLETELERGDLIKVEQALPGDVLCFWVLDPLRVIHAGIKTDYGLLHGWKTQVVEHGLVGSHWEKRIASVYQFPGVE